MESKRIIQVEDRVPTKLLVPLGTQHMFAMFEASILVPLLFDISPAAVLFMDGMGTLLFIFVTRGEASAYLGSSFVFLAPVGVVISSFGESGYTYVLGGFVVVGFCGCILASIMYKPGTEWIDIILPPTAMGLVVTLTELEFSGNAAQNAGLLGEVMGPKEIIVFMIILGTVVFGSILFRKFSSVIPILVAVIAGYVAAFAYRLLDFTAVAVAPVFAFPNFSRSKFNLDVIMIILPVLLVITSEHVGYQVVTSKVMDRDLLEDPGLHRSLFGDSFSTIVSSLIGSVPTTTYGEDIGVMAITRVYSARVITGATVLSIVCPFIEKLSTLISTIPGSVIGGISFLLYDMIDTSGLRILVDSRADYGNSRNLALTSVIFVTGLSGIAVKIGNIQLTGMVLVYVVGAILSLVSYLLDYFHLTNDQK